MNIYDAATRFTVKMQFRGSRFNLSTAVGAVFDSDIEERTARHKIFGVLYSLDIFL